MNSTVVHHGFKVGRHTHATKIADAVVHYAMGGIGAKVFASKYLTALPDTETLRREILATKHALETRAAAKRGEMP